MFVSVYLTDAHKHTVVPQEFILDLSQVSLNNNGVNSNQSRRIFFSKELFESLKNGEDISHMEYTPNFSIPISKIYPLTDGLGETCFIGRLKKIFGKCTKNHKNNKEKAITYFKFSLKFPSMMH